MRQDYETKDVKPAKHKAQPLDRKMIDQMQQREAKKKRENWRDVPPSGAACVTKKR